jgi:yecA family protein
MPAQAASGPATPEQLELLNKYLCSERAPRTCMLISQLEGFLTAIAAGPQRVPVNEWLPSVWGGAEPTFSDADQETAVIGAIMRRYNEIARSLEHGLVDPIYLTAPDDTPIVSHWAAGFLDAIRLRLDAWKPLLSPSGPSRCSRRSGRLLPASTKSRWPSRRRNKKMICCKTRRSWFQSAPRPSQPPGRRQGDSEPERTRVRALL